MAPETLDQFNVGLDASVAFLSLLLACYPRFSRAVDASAGRVFAGLCLANAAMAVADLLSWAFPLPLTGARIAVVMGANFVFNATAAVLLALFGRYLQLMLATCAKPACDGGPRGDSQAPKVLMPAGRAAQVVVAVYLAGCMVSLWNHMFFGVAPDTRYYRGGLYAVSQVLLGLLYVRCAAIIWVNRSLLGRCETALLLGYLMIPAVAEVVQAMNFGVALVNAAVLMSLMLMFVRMQSQREADIAERECAMMEERIELTINQVRLDDLCRELDEIKTLCGTDPERAAGRVGAMARDLRERMRRVGDTR